MQTVLTEALTDLKEIIHVQKVQQKGVCIAWPCNYKTFVGRKLASSSHISAVTFTVQPDHAPVHLILLQLKQLKYRLRLTRTDFQTCLFSFNYHVLTPMMEIYCFQILLFLLICLGYSVSDFWEPLHLESTVSSALEAWWKIHELPSAAYLSHLVDKLTFTTSTDYPWSFKELWLVYAKPRLTLRNLTFCPHSALHRD
jgi:hypothetical protein